MLSLYSPRPTWLHRVPAGAKLTVLAAGGTALQWITAPGWQAAAFALALAAFASLGAAAGRQWRLLRGIAVAAALVAGFHLWQGHTALAATSALRLLTTFLLAALLALTTRFDALLALLEWLLAPLAGLGVRPERLAMALGLVLRFAEHFALQWHRLDDAHRARSGRAGGVRLLAPMTLRMLQSADRVADALAARLGR